MFLPALYRLLIIGCCFVYLYLIICVVLNLTDCECKITSRILTAGGAIVLTSRATGPTLKYSFNLFQAQIHWTVINEIADIDNYVNAMYLGEMMNPGVWGAETRAQSRPRAADLQTLSRTKHARNGTELHCFHHLSFLIWVTFYALDLSLSSCCFMNVVSVKSVLNS